MLASAVVTAVLVSVAAAAANAALLRQGRSDQFYPSGRLSLPVAARPVRSPSTPPPSLAEVRAGQPAVGSAVDPASAASPNTSVGAAVANAGNSPVAPVLVDGPTTDPTQAGATGAPAASTELAPFSAPQSGAGTTNTPGRSVVTSPPTSVAASSVVVRSAATTSPTSSPRPISQVSTTEPHESEATTTTTERRHSGSTSVTTRPRSSTTQAHDDGKPDDD